MRITYIALLCACVPFFARAESTADLRGQRLAATCANCHGTNGNTVGERLPRLAGQTQAELLSKMQELKSGSRSNTVMQQLLKGYNDEQIAQLAAYFAAQKAKE